VEWNGSVVIITGASRGIGEATAVAAARKGARVGLMARDASDLDRVRKEIESAGGTCAVATADVADTAALTAAIGSLEGALGPVDVLVANAGIGSYGPFADLGEDEIERIMRVNVLGMVHAIRVVVPGMIERRRGHIVTMNSIAGRIGSPFEAIYAATKFAGVGLSEAISVELAPYGIGVSMIDPGPVETNFGEARGHVYDRKRPKPVSAARVADAVITAVEKNRLETYVPSSFRPAVIFRHLVPGVFRYGTAKSFTREIAEDRKKR
jgi:short-subunit dehydrogenase